ncbi:TIGR00725 family protein [Nocardioides coralli]|uniref:TIGR00725 family protein n=1 Tax=Nocardioides coralli TaxID=2872154 RepID=UPI001CA3DDDC|nr:TIGR00725 family protein [Nocardioides coralli]QZY29070.1 TIGR00725 family protein [Nocardioides coralli]
MNPTYVAVVGPSGDPESPVAQAAEEVGRLLAEAGCVVVTGGGTGVMAAASRGAAGAGGTTLGILPGNDRAEGNPHLTLAIPTGLGEVRNALVVRAADAVVAVGGSWGTLSEIALACRTGVRCVSLLGWDLPETGGPVVADSPAAAVRAALSSG